jgi:plasmid stabilization system protein ParE
VIRLVFRPAAAKDVEEGFRWYEEQRTGLGEEFLEEVERMVRAALESPQRYPIARRETRRALLQRFPYGLFYRVYGDRIVVVACMHVSRDPIRWGLRQ